MRAEEVDAPRIETQHDDPRFRLYAFTGAELTTTATDIRDCAVEAVVESGHAWDETRLWSLALVCGDEESQTLTWLSGYDYREPPRSPRQWAARRVMQDRYLSAQARGGRPVVLPNGLRVIRMFPGWAESPLWESFTDNYPASPAALGLSPELVGDLAAWNDRWNDHDPAEPMPDETAFLDEGRRLHRRVQAELDGIAEVRPEFDRG